MSYIAKSLAAHERLVMQARFPWVLRFSSWAALIGLGLVPAIGWMIASLSVGAAPGLGILAAGVGLIGIGIFAATQLYMAFTETGVTDQRFIIKRGIISRHATDLPLGALENVDLDQRILPRLLGYGRLTIAGSGETSLRTPPIQNPVGFRKAIADARIAVADRPHYDARATTARREPNVTAQPARQARNSSPADQRAGREQSTRKAASPRTPPRGLR